MSLRLHNASGGGEAAGAETLSPYIVRIIKEAKNRLGEQIFEKILGQTLIDLRFRISDLRVRAHYPGKLYGSRR